VEFEKDYRCECLRGKVYWLPPKVAKPLLDKKREAPFVFFERCKVRAMTRQEAAHFFIPLPGRYCETHQLPATLHYREGWPGWFVNY